MARAGRELAIVHGPQLPAQRLLGDRDAELLPEPLDQIDQPPAHHAVDGRDRALARSTRLPALAADPVEPRTGAGRLAGQQALGPSALKRSTQSRTICSVTPPIWAASVREAAIIDRRQGQKAPGLIGIPRALRQGAHSSDRGRRFHAIVGAHSTASWAGGPHRRGSWGQVSCWRQGSRTCAALSFRMLSPRQVDAMGVVDEAVEDGVGEGGVADHLVPCVDRHLAGDDGRAPSVAVLEDLQQVRAARRRSGPTGPSRRGSAARPAPGSSACGHGARRRGRAQAPRTGAARGGRATGGRRGRPCGRARRPASSCPTPVGPVISRFSWRLDPVAGGQMR